MLRGTNRKRRNPSGFTLLEVLIAVFVAATALLAVWKLHAQMITLVSDVRFQMSAPLLAQKVLAEIDGLPPERHDSGPCNTDDANAAEGDASLRCEIFIEWLDPEPWKAVGSSVEKIDITVSDGSDTNRLQLRAYRFHRIVKEDALAKSRNTTRSIIPSKEGIQ